MRLGFDGKRATQNFRGLGNYSRGLIEGLLHYSAEDLFIYSPPVSDRRAKEWIDSEGNPKDRFHLKTPETFLEKKLSSLWRSYSIVGDLKKDKLDLYHGLSHEIPVGISSLPLKSVVTIHDLIFLRYPEFFPFIDRMVYKQKFTYSTKNADMVIAICEQTKRDLIEFLGVDEKKIVVHYQSCDPRFYVDQGLALKESVKEKYKLVRPFILNVGAFEERKNQKKLIRAFAKSYKNFEHDLVLIGAGKIYRDECIALATELNLRERIKFLSDVPHTDLPAIYQMASLFCFPSIFEGFGIPIIEALFSKIPVLTSFGSCFPESAGPMSEYIDPLSVDDISSSLVRILGDKNLRDTMVSRGYEFTQKFHQKNSTAALLDCYFQLF
jgi:glycosyltransferase involved in cell wall biosynthesis